MNVNSLHTQLRLAMAEGRAPTVPLRYNSITDPALARQRTKLLELIRVGATIRSAAEQTGLSHGTAYRIIRASSSKAK